MDFKAGPFGELARSRTAKKLWDFLSERQNADRLEFASELGHAALDGVVERLEHAFPRDLKDARTRQMVGAMIRQILEDRGWQVEKSGLKVRRGNLGLFAVATRYTRSKAGAAQDH